MAPLKNYTFVFQKRPSLENLKNRLDVEKSKRRPQLLVHTLMQNVISHQTNQESKRTIQTQLAYLRKKITTAKTDLLFADVFEHCSILIQKLQHTLDMFVRQQQELECQLALLE